MTQDLPSAEAPDWRVFTGSGIPHDKISQLPDPPGWRTFLGEVIAERSLVEDLHVHRRFGRPGPDRTLQLAPATIDAVNAALYLRRPLLVTGRPGTGKSSLAYAVAYELRLGSVLSWSITSRSTRLEGLYQYDAIGRLQDSQLKPGEEPDLGRYLRLGPLGTALLPAHRPRVLLIDEIDKSDIDLPNDLLNVFEEGSFEIPELQRLADLSGRDREVRVRPADSRGPEDTVPIVDGKVTCRAFPFVVLTSNGEREFPPPFLRRCIRLDLPLPEKDELANIVEFHLGPEAREAASGLIGEFLTRRQKGDLAIDQLLNAVYLITREHSLHGSDKDSLVDALLKHLNSADGT